jgi:hypothetical protein
LPETLALRVCVAVTTIEPLPLSAASESRALSWPKKAVPSPPIITSSRVVVPAAWMSPFPARPTVRLGPVIPVALMFPSPCSVSSSREGTLTATNIGVLTLTLPGVVPITRLPDWTRVVTRLSRFVSPCTMTDRLPPTCTTTSFSPVRSTPVNGASERACVAATPEPVPAGLLALVKVRRASSAGMNTARTIGASQSELRLNITDRVDSPERPEQPGGRRFDGGGSQ